MIFIRYERDKLKRSGTETISGHSAPLRRSGAAIPSQAGSISSLQRTPRWSESDVLDRHAQVEHAVTRLTIAKKLTRFINTLSGLSLTAPAPRTTIFGKNIQF
jgi:hypothetical protein